MESAISLFIIGNNKFMVEMLLEALGNYNDINIVGVAENSLEAVELIKELKPHIILLDVFEPDIKELRILKKANELKQGHRPLIIILSEQGNSSKVKKTMALGVKEYLVKPIDSGILISRIRQVYNEHYSKKWPKPLYSPDIAQQISIVTAQLLYGFGILSHLHGYKYIKEAIFYMVNNPKDCKPFRKVLYPLIAEEFGTTPQKVETAIRNAIENAWKKNINLDNVAINDNSMLKIFNKKPTNSQFISALANRVRSILNTY